MRWFELRLAGASGRCTTAGAPRRNAGTGGRPLQPAVCWSRLWRSPCSGPFDRLGTQTRRSFRDRRIPMRPDVPPGGASSDGGQWMLRSRRLGPGRTCRSGDGSPENSPWAICTIGTARRGRWVDGSGKWQERGYQPAFSARRTSKRFWPVRGPCGLVWHVFGLPVSPPRAQLRPQHPSSLIRCRRGMRPEHGGAHARHHPPESPGP